MLGFLRELNRRGGVAIALILLLSLLSACASLPTEYVRTESVALSDTQDTRLGREVGKLMAGKQDLSAIYSLSRGVDALAARLMLADSAERSLNVQYFLWHEDTVGKLLMDRLLAAADRGVRVRLLLDDIGSSGYDQALAAIDLHPNLEVRLFNPFAMRHARFLEFMTSFSRVNRRMHNKSFTADNQLTIVGGRNMGDEYFEARPDISFGDLDVLLTGPVVPEVSSAFDLYWNSELAFPITALTQPATNAQSDEIRSVLREHRETMIESPYLKAVQESQFVKELAQGQLPLFWGKAHVFYDDPRKLMTHHKDEATHLRPQMEPFLDNTRAEIIALTPYMVPEKSGVAQIDAFQQRGVQVRILTNSLASNNHFFVHAGYAPYRLPMLRAGAELYEAKPNVGARPEAPDKRLGSSRGVLHSKVFVFDRQRVFVGSYNLDPRSRDLNTELGVMLHSPEYAQTVSTWFDEWIGKLSFRLRLIEIPPSEENWYASPSQRLEWVTEENGKEIRFYTDPYTSVWRRMMVQLLSFLPIEGQL